MSEYAFECYAKGKRGKIIARKTVIAVDPQTAAETLLRSIATIPGIERIEAHQLPTYVPCT